MKKKKEEEESDLELEPFANETNRQLYSKVKANQQLVYSKQKELNDEHDRINTMKLHLKDVLHETKHLQNIIAQKDQALKSSKNIKNIKLTLIKQLQKNEIKMISEEKIEIESDVNDMHKKILKNQKNKRFCYKK